GRTPAARSAGDPPRSGGPRHRRRRRRRSGAAVRHDNQHRACRRADALHRAVPSRGASQARTADVRDIKLGGARSRSPPDPALMRLSSSPPSHYRLTPYDLVSSQAHARELERAGLLTDAECATIVAALDAMRREFAAGALVPAAGDEDVHTFLERVL